MAETFASFGLGDPFGRGNVYSGKAGSAESFTQQLPPELLRQLNELAKSGIFGPGGVEALQASIRRQGGLQRSRLARGLKQRAGRRLGPRSGVIDTMIANDIYAPSFAGEEQGYRDLQLANQQSKVGGLQGMQQLLEFFQRQFGMEKELEVQKPGIMDFLNPAIDIASIFAAPATGGASLAVPAVTGGLQKYGGRA